jgi:hypothetical protein
MSCEPCFGGVDRPHVVELYRRNAAVAKPFRTLWISTTHGRLAVADLTDQAIAAILIYSGPIGPDWTRGRADAPDLCAWP